MKKRNITWIIVLITLGLLCIALSCLFRKQDSNGSDIDDGTDIIEPKVDEGKTLMELDHYKSIKVDNISSLYVKKLTVGGDTFEEVTDEAEIAAIYNNLNSKKVGEKTTNACDDNTTFYIFNLVDDSTVSIEIECDHVVIDNERYLIK